MKKIFNIMLVLITTILLTNLISCTPSVSGDTKEQIKITYDLNYENSKSTTVTEYKGKAFTLESFTREGFFLAGWANNADAENPDYQAAQSVEFEEDKTLYAIWVNKNEVVTLYLYPNGPDSDTTKTIKIAKGKEYTLPFNTFEQKGKAFVGWSESSSSSYVSYYDGETLNTSKTNYNIYLYAVWYDVTSPDVCKITFDSNDGSGKTETQYVVKLTSQYSSYKLMPNRFEREGYVFDGWSTKADAEEPDYEKDEKIPYDYFGTGENFEKSKTLYAVWLDKSKLKIKFYRYNSDDDKEYSSFLVDMDNNKAEYTLPDCMFNGLKEKYAFSSWKTYEGGSSSVCSRDYYPGETYTFESETVRKICYATFQVKIGDPFIKTVYYYANKNAEPYIFYYDWSFQEEIAVLKNMFPDEEGEFLGWASSSYGTEPNRFPEERYETGPGAKVKAPTELYACFRKDITLTLKSNNSVKEEKQITVKSFSPVSLPQDTFTNGNQKLACWGKTSSSTYNSSSTYKFDTDNYFNGDTTLYAVWVNPLKFRFSSNGGDQDTVEVNSYTYIETKCPVEFSRDGYKFIGFSTETKGAAQFSGNSSTETKVRSTFSQTVNVYAVWSKNTTIKMRSGIESVTPDYDINVDTNVKMYMPNTSYTANLLADKYESWNIPESYVLKGWKIIAGDNKTEKITYGPSSNSLAIYNDTIAIEADWYKPMIITYHANDGTDNTTQQIIGYSTYSSYFGLNSNTFEREGYTFMGWSTTPEGTVVNINDEEYIYWDEGAEYDYYAVWKAN